MPYTSVLFRMHRTYQGLGSLSTGGAARKPWIIENTMLLPVLTAVFAVFTMNTLALSVSPFSSDFAPDTPTRVPP
jgi:hypothetical protein